MREQYDFSKMKGRKNSYIKYLKQPVAWRAKSTCVSAGVIPNYNQMTARREVL